jgi:peptidoglycan-associated lipoprotein
MSKIGIWGLTAAALLGACAKKPVRNAAPETRPVEAAKEPVLSASVPENRGDSVRALVAEVFRPVYFPFDRSELTDSAKAILAKAGDLLKREPSLSVLVSGNTDDRGTDAYNLALGQRRAAVVRDYLVHYGVPASRLRLISYGEEKPARPGNSESDWAFNRRDEFEVSF